MKNIVLTGFMGTGKTEVGRELARLLGISVIDIDHEIEKSSGTAIPEIFLKNGEDYFRRLETETIRRISASDGIIISTGGGAVLREENIAALRENGMIFCLTASPEVIAERTSASNDRPLLTGDDRMARIASLLSQRRPYYEKAGIMINTENKTPLQIAREIAEIYNG